MKHDKVVVFDWDGTATPKKYISLMNVVDSGISALARSKAQALRDIYMPLVLAGKLTLEQETNWLRQTLKTYIGEGLTVSRVRELLKGVSLRPGVADCLRLLLELDVPVAIVSYGTEAFIEALLEIHGVEHCVNCVFSAIMVQETDTGRYVDYLEESFVFPSTKGDWSRRFAAVHGVTPQNILAVGDSLGDMCLGCLQELRLGIAKDETEKRKIAPVMGQVVVIPDSGDFGPVTAWLKEKLDLA